MRLLSIRDNGTYDECDSGAYTYSSRMRDLKKRKIVDLGNGECLYCHHPLNQPTTTTTITSVDGEYRGNRIIKKEKKKRDKKKEKEDAFHRRIRHTKVQMSIFMRVIFDSRCFERIL